MFSKKSKLYEIFSKCFKKISMRPKKFRIFKRFIRRLVQLCYKVVSYKKRVYMLKHLIYPRTHTHTHTQAGAERFTHNQIKTHLLMLIYTYTHTHTHTHTPTHTHTHTQWHPSKRTQPCMHAGMQRSVYSRYTRFNTTFRGFRGFRVFVLHY